MFGWLSLFMSCTSLSMFGRFAGSWFILRTITCSVTLWVTWKKVKKQGSIRDFCALTGALKIIENPIIIKREREVLIIPACEHNSRGSHDIWLTVGKNILVRAVQLRGEKLSSQRKCPFFCGRILGARGRRRRRRKWDAAVCGNSRASSSSSPHCRLKRARLSKIQMRWECVAGVKVLREPKPSCLDHSRSGPAFVLPDTLLFFYSRRDNEKKKARLRPIVIYEKWSQLRIFGWDVKVTGSA